MSEFIFVKETLLGFGISAILIIIIGFAFRFGINRKHLRKYRIIKRRKSASSEGGEK